MKINDLRQLIKEQIEKLNEENKNDAIDFINDIESTIKKHFPKSYILAKFSTMLGVSHITVTFCLGNEKDWPNKIEQNDIAHNYFFIYNMNKTGNMDDILRLKTESSLSFIITPQKNKYVAYERIKVPFKNKKGNKKSILDTIDKSFASLKQTMKDNINLFPPDHIYAKKYL